MNYHRYHIQITKPEGLTLWAPQLWFPSSDSSSFDVSLLASCRVGISQVSPLYNDIANNGLQPYKG